MELLEKKKFTQPAVLFALTGHVFLKEDMSESYIEQSLAEIKEDAVYKFVMRDVPSNILKSAWEMYDGEEQDIDPILVQYICSQNMILKHLKHFIDGSTLEKATEVIRRDYLNQGYVEIESIDFLSFTSIAEEVCKQLSESVK